MKELVWDPQQFREHFEKGTNSNKILLAMETRKLEFYLNEMKFKKTDVVLDIGCGYGRFGMHVRDTVEKVVGIDINPDNISYAKQYVGDKFEGHVVDLSKGLLPLTDNSVDKIIMENVLTFLSKDQQVELFKEIKRVIKPGGIIAFNIENSEYAFMPVYHFFSRLYKLKSQLLRRPIPVHHRCPLSFYIDTLKQLTFSNIKTLGNTYYRKMGIGKLEVFPKIVHGYISKLDAAHSNTQKNIKMSTITVVASLP